MAASEIGIYVGAFVAIACHCDGHVIYDRTVPVITICNWEDLSAQRFVCVRENITWSRFLSGLATGLSVCVVHYCRLTAMFTSSLPAEQIVFFRPETVCLILGSNRPHSVLRRASVRPESGW